MPDDDIAHAAFGFLAVDLDARYRMPVVASTGTNKLVPRLSSEPSSRLARCNVIVIERETFLTSPRSGTIEANGLNFNRPHL